MKYYILDGLKLEKIRDTRSLKSSVSGLCSLCCLLSFPDKLSAGVLRAVYTAVPCPRVFMRKLLGVSLILYKLFSYKTPVVLNQSSHDFSLCNDPTSNKVILKSYGSSAWFCREKHNSTHRHNQPLQMSCISEVRVS